MLQLRPTHAESRDDAPHASRACIAVARKAATASVVESPLAGIARQCLASDFGGRTAT